MLSFSCYFQFLSLSQQLACSGVCISLLYKLTVYVGIWPKIILAIFKTTLGRKRGAFAVLNHWSAHFMSLCLSV